MQVFVTGMHRSGTSVVSRLLNLMGLNLGAHAALMQKKPENPTGFWERDDVKRVNDRILGQQNCSWSRVLAMRPALVCEFVDDATRSGITSIVEELEIARPWVVKDPRFCLTMDAWLPYVDVPGVVVSIRHPISTARSLRARSAIPIDAAIALMDFYLCSLGGAARRHTGSGMGLFLVRWEELRSSPDSVLARISQEMGDHFGSAVPRMPGSKETLALLRDDVGETDVGDFDIADPRMRRCIERLAAVSRAEDLLDLPEPDEWTLETLASFQTRTAPEESIRAVSHKIGRIETVISQLAAEIKSTRKASEAAPFSAEQGGSAFVEAIRSVEDKLLSRLDSLESELSRKAEEQIDVPGKSPCSQQGNPQAASPQTPASPNTAEHYKLKAETEIASATTEPVNSCVPQPEVRSLPDNRDRKREERLAVGGRVLAAFEPVLDSLRRRIRVAKSANREIDHSVHVVPLAASREQVEALKEHLATIRHALLAIEESAGWRGARAIGRIVRPKAKEDAVTLGIKAVGLAAVVASQLSDLTGDPPAFAADRLTSLVEPDAVLRELGVVLDVLMPALASLEQFDVAASAPRTSESTRSMQPRMLIQMTSQKTRNHYYSSLGAAMSATGREVRYSTDVLDMVRYSLDPKANLTLWFHQLEPFYRPDPRVDRAIVERSAEQFIASLIFLKNRGVRLVHTWHNRVPHDRRHLRADISLYSRLADVFDLVFVHAYPAVEWVRKWVGGTRVCVVPHHSLPLSSSSTAHVRSSRSTAGYKKFITFGEFKPYKSLWLLADAWAQLVESGLLPADASLTLLGKWLDSAELKDRLSRMPGVVLMDQSYDDDFLASQLDMADCSVFTHADIWVSGAAVTSLSRGVPAIVPDSACMADYVTDGQQGMTFTNRSAHSLAETFRRAFETDRAAHMPAMASAWADEHPLSRIVAQYNQELVRLD